MLLKFLLVEGKKAGFKDPWASVNETSSPLIVSIHGVWGRSGDQINMNETMGIVRPLFGEDPYTAESHYPKKASSVVNIIYTSTARPQCHKIV